MTDLTPWKPLRMLSRWPSVWDDDDFGLSFSGSNNLELYETAEEVVVKANVAGVKPEDVDLTFEKGVLWVKAQRQEEEEDEERKHYSKSSWTYSYKVAVPGTLDFSQEPEAQVEDGVLTVTFQKAESSKPRKLKVKAK
jgi:HSP20 family protein